MDQPRSLFHLFLVFSNTQYILQKLNVKNVMPIQLYETGIWTHNLSNMSCLP